MRALFSEVDVPEGRRDNDITNPFRVSALEQRLADLQKMVDAMAPSNLGAKTNVVAMPKP